MVKDLKEISMHENEFLNKEITVQGWIRNHRKQKEFGFIDFNDGTQFNNLQIVYEKDLENFDEIQYWQCY